MNEAKQDKLIFSSSLLSEIELNVIVGKECKGEVRGEDWGGYHL